MLVVPRWALYEAFVGWIENISGKTGGAVGSSHPASQARLQARITYTPTCIVAIDLANRRVTDAGALEKIVVRST